LLLLERPLTVGDVLEAQGLVGEVKRIGLRSTTIRTAQGAEVILPNNKLIVDQVTNWTLSERQRRVDLPVGVAYGTDLEAVIKLLVEVATSHPGVVHDPAPVALFMGFGKSALDFELRFWAPSVKTYQQLKSDVAVQVCAAFRKAGIEIPGEAQFKSPNAAVQETSALQSDARSEA
jgi:small-conductance mechanosensitive channel